jgi:hypothetical protein
MQRSTDVNLLRKDHDGVTTISIRSRHHLSHLWRAATDGLLA